MSKRNKQNGALQMSNEQSQDPQVEQSVVTTTTEQPATDPVVEETKVQEVAPVAPTAIADPALAAVIVQQQNVNELARENITSQGVFEGTKVSAALEKVLNRYKGNEDVLSVARDAFAFVAKNKAGVPQTDESCVAACRQLLSRISSIYRDADNFSDKYTMLVAVAREYDDVCFSPELLFRGAPGLSESDYKKYQAAATLLIESAHLANPKMARKNQDITKMMQAFGNSDITNRVLAWYE